MISEYQFFYVILNEKEEITAISYNKSGLHRNIYTDSFKNQSQTYSKSHNTFKALVGISATGAVVFCYGEDQLLM